MPQDPNSGGGPDEWGLFSFIGETLREESVEGINLVCSQCTLVEASGNGEIQNWHHGHAAAFRVEGQFFGLTGALSLQDLEYQAYLATNGVPQAGRWGEYTLLEGGLLSMGNKPSPSTQDMVRRVVVDCCSRQRQLAIDMATAQASPGRMRTRL